MFSEDGYTEIWVRLAINQSTGIGRAYLIQVTFDHVSFLITTTTPDL
jgi:hypothetical protein